MQHRERYAEYLLSRPVKAENIPSYCASIRQVEKALGSEVDTLLQAGLSQLIDKIQSSNPHFAGVSARQLANLRTAVRRYAEVLA
jgi:hypothetical protein